LPVVGLGAGKFGGELHLVLGIAFHFRQGRLRIL